MNFMLEDAKRALQVLLEHCDYINNENISGGDTLEKSIPYHIIAQARAIFDTSENSSMSINIGGKIHTRVSSINFSDWDTYNGWCSKGYFVVKGSCATRVTANGVALFHKTQVKLRTEPAIYNKTLEKLRNGNSQKE